MTSVHREPPRIFLLSPAHPGGKRAAILMREEARFPVAVRLRSGGGVPLGEAFSFVSGLYFRGKLAYASRFGRASAGASPAQVITANRGLLAADTLVTVPELQAFGGVDIRADDSRYRGPLVRDLTRLAREPSVEFVLLGSLATGKYVDVLLDVIGERLLYPIQFEGRGDMSRGALLLRASRAGEELAYAPVATALARLRPNAKRLRQGPNR